MVGFDAVCDALCAHPTLRAVVLNACHTAALARLLKERGMLFTMYWKGKVHNDAVPTFSRFFHLALHSSSAAVGRQRWCKLDPPRLENAPRLVSNKSSKVHKPK